MPWVGFETMIPASERVKAVRALDRAANMIGGLGTSAVENIASTLHNNGKHKDRKKIITIKKVKLSLYLTN
jgi:hypothetical protein